MNFNLAQTVAAVCDRRIWRRSVTAATAFAVCPSLLLCNPNGLQAKAKDAKSPDKPSFEFTCAIFEVPKYGDLFYRDGNKEVPLALRPIERSVSYKMFSASNFELLVPKVAADGSVEYTLLGSSPIPEGIKRAMFLIESRPDQGDGRGGLQIKAFDDSLEIFPPGSFQFVNSTSTLLRVDFGGVSHPVAPNGTSIAVPASKAEGFLPLAIFSPEGKTLFETRMFWEPRTREFVLIKQPQHPGLGTLQIQFISETVPLTKQVPSRKPKKAPHKPRSLSPS